MSCEFCSDPDARRVVLESPDSGRVKAALCREHRDALCEFVVEPITEAP